MTDQDTAPHYSGPELCALPARTVVAMLKAGAILDVTGIVVVCIAVMTLGGWVLGAPQG